MMASGMLFIQGSVCRQIFGQLLTYIRVQLLSSGRGDHSTNYYSLWSVMVATLILVCGYNKGATLSWLLTKMPLSLVEYESTPRSLQ